MGRIEKDIMHFESFAFRSSDGKESEDRMKDQSNVYNLLHR
jgi:hypothetical protein